MSLAQVAPMRAILSRVHGIATDADMLASMVYDALLDAADQTERLDLKIIAARDELKRIDALLGAAAEANSPSEAMRQVADEMRERLGALIGAIIIETATVSERRRTP